MKFDKLSTKEKIKELDIRTSNLKKALVDLNEMLSITYNLSGIFQSSEGVRCELLLKFAEEKLNE